MRAARTAFAFAVAALWALHPLQTESVTYIVQRAESSMGLCYWFTLYAAVRAAGAGSSGQERMVGGGERGCLHGGDAVQGIHGDGSRGGRALRPGVPGEPVAELPSRDAGGFILAWRYRGLF